MNRVGVYAYLLCAVIVNICIHINVECLGFRVIKMNCIDVLLLMSRGGEVFASSRGFFVLITLAFFTVGIGIFSE